MPLDTFISGAYTSTYNAVSPGITEEGFKITQELKQEVIDQSDAHGDATLDYVYRGGNAFCMFDCKAYKAGSTTPFWPWATALGLMSTAAAPIGRLASDVAVSFVLTSVANTPAAAAPATLTATKAILAPNFSGDLLFNSKLRRVPIRLQFLPYLSTNHLWFALT